MGGFNKNRKGCFPQEMIIYAALTVESLLPFCYHNTPEEETKPATKIKFGSRVFFRFL